MKADVLQLVQDLSSNQADASAIGRYYDDVVRDLGQRPWLTQTTLIAVTADTAIYSPASTVIRILDVYYDNHVLDQVDLQSLESINSRWRDEWSTPVAYTTEQEDSKDFRIYPNPEINSKDFIFAFGEPFGRDYPEYAVVIVHTETRVDLPLWLEMPVAFEILYREFSRESNHRDIAFAATCKQIGDLMMRMVA